MNKENRRGSSIVKLFWLFPLVMAAIGLNAEHLGVLTIGGEKHYFGKDYPLTQHYSCGAIATYDPDKAIDDDGVFDVEFTEDATIVASLPTGSWRTEIEDFGPGTVCSATISLAVLNLRLNGHVITVVPPAPQFIAHLYSEGSLNVYGGDGTTPSGTLNIQHGSIGSYNGVGIYGTIVNISEAGNDETEVTAIHTGLRGSLTVSDSHISITGYSKLIQPQHGFSCTGSMLDLVSWKSAHGDSVSDTAVIEDGNYQVGGHGISLSGSVVSIVSEHPGMSGIRPRGKLLVEDSCVAIVSDRSCFRLDVNYSGGSQKDFRNARISAVSMTGNGLEGGDTDSEKSVATFGSGEYVFCSSGNKQGGNLMDDPEYYLNPEGKIAALVSGRIAIDGGNLEICAPNAYGCDTHEFTMKDGSLKMVDTIDHSKTVHAILDETAVKETVSANAQFAGWTAAHSQMLKNMLAHQDAAGVGAFAGRAGSVIETERFFQSGGRIDPGTALYGGYIASYNAGWNWAAPVFTGGSLKMDFRYFYYQSGVKEYRAMTPINDLGQKLMRVDYEPYWVSIPPLSGEGSLGFPTMAQLSGGPYSAWCKPLVLRSASPYDVEYVPVLTFEKGASPYVQWLIANFGSSPTACPSMLFEILSLDGKTLYWDWKSCSELGPGLAASINYKWDRFKELAEGCYILRMTLDPHNQMQDSYRGDNVATYIFTVTSPGSTVHAVTYKPGAYGVGLEQTAMKQNGMALMLGGAFFTRRGYKQTGWSLTDGGAKAYDLNGTYTTDAEMVLYPYWTVNLVEPAETIDEALGVPGLECSPYGSTEEWQLRIDPDWTCDGNGSLTVGNKVMEGTFSPGFSFKVTGPTQMKFSYSKSTSATFYVESSTAGTLYRDNTSGEKTDWKQVVLDIPAGEQAVNFRALLVFRNEYDYTGFWIDDLQLGDFEHEIEAPDVPQLSWTDGVSRLYETLDLKYIWPKPYVGAAAVYDGYLSDADGIVRGMIQVKVAKGKTDRKTGKFLAKVTATVQLADEPKKISFKGGVVDSDTRGLASAMSAGGHVLNVQVGEYGLGGTMDGLTIDGARNVFTGKYEGDGEFADAASGCMGVYNLAGGSGALSVSVAKKGKVKISGTVNGVKVSATSQLLVGNEVCCIPIVIAKKTSLALNLLTSKDGKGVMVQGADSKSWTAGKAGNIGLGAKFRMDGAAGVRALPRLYGEYLPNGIDVAASGTKWIVAGGVKAGKVAFVKGGNTIDESKLGTNPSGLKLTYKQKDGTFKGSFKMYCLESNGKIKAYTANVTGVMIGAKGYGTATIKKPACMFQITVE